MNANYGYQLYQAERTQTRARSWRATHDAAAGRSFTTRAPEPARKGRGRGIMVIIAGRTARAA